MCVFVVPTLTPSWSSKHSASKPTKCVASDADHKSQSRAHGPKGVGSCPRCARCRGAGTTLHRYRWPRRCRQSHSLGCTADADSSIVCEQIPAGSYDARRHDHGGAAGIARADISPSSGVAWVCGVSGAADAHNGAYCRGEYSVFAKSWFADHGTTYAQESFDK